MFTGIIEHTGTVISLDTAGDSAVLRVRAGSIARDLAAGGSLAVDGVCLTALGTQADPEVFTADVMGESLARTTLGRLRPGDAVNLERCLPAGGRFDGHLVQGHVDATGIIAAITEHPAWTTLRITVPAHLAPQLAEKGSIALNGISLTVTRTSPADAAEHWFEVGIIPATLRATTLGTARPGDPVNLETDAVAKYLLRAREFEDRLLGGPLLTESSIAAAPTTPPARPGAARGTGLAAARGTGPKSLLDPVERAVEAIAAGGLAVVVDDEDRENEGDLIGAASLATPAALAFMIRHTSGVVCAPMSAERAEALDLPPMTARNQDPKGTAYTVTCDAAAGVTTGISAADRARTLTVLADPTATPADLTRPGHLLPLRAHPGGLRSRAGHTEAAVELTRLAGLPDVGYIAEVVREDGAMMRVAELRAFADEHGLPMISIEDLAVHARRREEEEKEGALR